ncbi:MAG: HD domain-containing phosphohydrolase, partial [Thermaerobacterales bacterium]
MNRALMRHGMAGGIMLALLVLTALITSAGRPIGTALAFAVAVAAAERIPVLRTGHQTISLAPGLALAAIWVLGWPAAAIPLALGWNLYLLITPAARQPMLMSIANLLLAPAAAYLGYLQLGSVNIEAAPFTVAALPYLGAGLGFLAIHWMTAARSTLTGQLPVRLFARSAGFALVSLTVSGACLWLAAIDLRLVMPLLPALILAGALVRHLYDHHYGGGWLRRLFSGIPRRPKLTDRADRMLRYSDRFGEHLGLDRSEIADLRCAALLHDLYLPVSQGVDPLTFEEWERVENHPARAAEAIRRLDVLPPRVEEIVRYHHEHWDGKGYPAGLKGADIPLGARVLHVLEVFDALTTARPYRSSLPLAQALGELSRAAGTQLDPQMVKAFIQMVGDPGGKLWPIPDAGDFEERGAYLPGGFEAALTAELQRVAGYDEGRSDAVARGHFADRDPSFTILDELLPVMGATLRVDQVLDRALQICRRLTGLACWATLPAPDGSRLLLAAGLGFQKPAGGCSFSLSDNPSAAAMARRRAVETDIEVAAAGAGGPANGSPQPDGCYRFLPAGRWRVLAVPLVRVGRSLGTLEVARSAAEPGWSCQERELMRVLAGAAALALDNAMLYEETSRRLLEMTEFKRFTDLILDRVSVCLLVCDAEGKMILLNDATRQAMDWAGFDWRSVMGRSLTEQDGRLRVWSMMQNCLHQGVEQGQTRLRLYGDPEGERVHEVRCFPVRGTDGAVMAVVATAVDVTH